MAIFQTVNGFYGSGNTPCTILYYDSWYCVQGSCIVNKLPDHEIIIEGTNVETLEDIDCFTWDEPIETLEELKNAVEG